MRSQKLSRKDPLSLFKRVEAYLLEHKIDLPRKKVLLAVSGGPDSMFLMHYFNWMRPRYQLDLTVAHIEHGMRPDQDPKETAFVEEAAGALGIEMLLGKIDPTVLGQKGSKEELLREERYRLLKEMAYRSGSHFIALGHQMDDQVETLLIRLLRGSGTRGLGSMKVITGTFLRPLLCVKKEEIIDYLEDEGIKYVVDPTNTDVSYLRNKIRMELIPYLKTIQPNLNHVLSRTSEILGIEADYFEVKSHEWLRLKGEISENLIKVPILELKKEHPAIQFHIMRTVYLMMKGSLKRLTNEHIKKLYNLLSQGRSYTKLSLPGNLVFLVEDEILSIKREYEEEGSFCPIEITGPGRYKLWNLPLLLEVSMLEGGLSQICKDRNKAFLDIEKISFPLKVRTYLPGDWFIPLGMEGKKKLQDFFVDLKIPRNVRKKIPLVLSGERIVWIAGLRIDHSFRVTEKTQNTLLLRLIKEGPGP